MNRDFSGYVFQLIGPIDPERAASGAVREFMPQSRYRNARNLPLNSHGKGPFCQFTAARGLRNPGVYVLILVGQPVYVGKCHDLAERFGPRGYGAIQPKNCFVGGQSTNCKVNNLILLHARQGQQLELWFHATADAASVERDLITKIRPQWNNQIPW